MTILTWKTGAFAGLIIGSAIGATAMYFACKKKMNEQADKLEREYRECMDGVIKQMDEAKQEAVENAREIALKAHYATPEEVMMEMEEDPKHDPYFSVEDSRRISLEEYEEDLPDEEYERYTWYYDPYTGEVTEENGSEVEFFFGEILDNMIKELEKEETELAPGDDFFIRNDTHEFFAQIVMLRATE